MTSKSATLKVPHPKRDISPASDRFSVSHLKSSEFKADGLRPFFAYRDLGVKDATRGRFVAHVIRAVPGQVVQSSWHQHEADFQMVYVVKGWIEFEYEDEGTHRYEAGSCFYQPKNIRHVELGHSDDVEMIEIVSPGDFRTFED